MRLQTWLSCSTPSRLLEAAHSQLTQRKQRLFACACCRSIWHLIRDEAGKAAVEVAERHVDQPDWERMQETRRTVEAAARHSWALWDDGSAEALEATVATTNDDPELSAFEASGYAARAAQSAADGDVEQWKAERRRQCNLIRDLFENPMLPPVRIDRSWLDWRGGIVLRMARSVYEEHRFEELPILADALEDAGCAVSSILDHLRGPGPHFKGSWCLDLLLART
jgi:hypothetical protein